MPTACQCTPCPLDPIPYTPNGQDEVIGSQGEKHSLCALCGLEDDRERVVTAGKREHGSAAASARRSKRNGRTTVINRAKIPALSQVDPPASALRQARSCTGSVNDEHRGNPRAQIIACGCGQATYLCAPYSCSSWITSAELR